MVKLSIRPTVNVVTTSFEVNGEPSDHLRFGRSFTEKTFPSSLLDSASKYSCFASAHRHIASAGWKRSRKMLLCRMIPLAAK